MTEEPKKPERHSDLRDPKLPAINGGPSGNRAEGRICTANPEMNCACRRMTCPSDMN